MNTSINTLTKSAGMLTGGRTVRFGNCEINIQNTGFNTYTIDLGYTFSYIPIVFYNILNPITSSLVPTTISINTTNFVIGVQTNVAAVYALAWFAF